MPYGVNISTGLPAGKHRIPLFVLGESGIAFPRESNLMFGNWGVRAFNRKANAEIAKNPCVEGALSEKHSWRGL